MSNIMPHKVQMVSVDAFLGEERKMRGKVRGIPFLAGMDLLFLGCDVDEPEEFMAPESTDAVELFLDLAFRPLDSMEISFGMHRLVLRDKKTLHLDYVHWVEDVIGRGGVWSDGPELADPAAYFRDAELRALVMPIVPVEFRKEAA